VCAAVVTAVMLLAGCGGGDPSNSGSQVAEAPDGTFVTFHQTGRTQHLPRLVAASLGVPADVDRWDVWEFVRADVLRMTGCPVTYFGHSRERAFASGADVGRYRGRQDWYVALDC
jgi:hypothetical protein